MLYDHPVSGKWSFLECLCHVTDFEIVFLDRIKRILAENNPLILGASEQGYAANLYYDKRSFENELALFNAARRQLVEIVTNMREADFNKTCIHNEIGKMTAGDWIRKAIGHAEHHFLFMDEKRKAMGLPVVGIEKQEYYP